MISKYANTYLRFRESIVLSWSAILINQEVRIF
jgi:hypothetical protein